MQELNFEQNYLLLNKSEIDNIFFNFDLDNIEIDFSFTNEEKMFKQYKLILQYYVEIELKESKDILIENQIIEDVKLNITNECYVLELKLMNNIMRIKFKAADLLLFD